jgi:hypothetical protein
MNDLIERLRARYNSAEGSDLDCEAANELDRLRSRLATVVDERETTVADLRRELADIKAERTGTIHESWQHKTHAEVLEGLKWQGAITKSQLAADSELRAQLAEARELLKPCECCGAPLVKVEAGRATCWQGCKYPAETT